MSKLTQTKLQLREREAAQVLLERKAAAWDLVLDSIDETDEGELIQFIALLHRQVDNGLPVERPES